MLGYKGQIAVLIVTLISLLYSAVISGILSTVLVKYYSIKRKYKLLKEQDKDYLKISETANKYITLSEYNSVLENRNSNKKEH